MEIQPIGAVRSCFGDKFAVPRQPSLCPSSWGELRFAEGYRDLAMVRGLETFSHLWLIFGFHATQEQGWSPTVRPPRLGGNQRVGVWATRSTFRPNGLGLSLVRLEEVVTDGGEAWLRLGGLDLIDGTPVYDVKPYLPFTDAVPEAVGGYAHEAPAALEVEVYPAASEAYGVLPERMKRLLRECLGQDPRPAVQVGREGKQYGARLGGYEVRFHFPGDGCEILSIEPMEGSGLNY